MSKKKIFWTCVSIFILLSIAVYLVYKPNTYSIQINGALDTVSQIKVVSNAKNKSVINDCREMILYYDDILSHTKENSDINKINENSGNGENVVIHGKTAQMLSIATEISLSTNGAFDITTGALVDLWNRAKESKQLPLDVEVSENIDLVDYNDLLINENHTGAMLLRDGQAINVGGIAKGYIADELAKLLHSKGVESAMINLGGNTLAIGKKIDGTKWRVGIQDPVDPNALIAEVSITDMSVVTSGDYERYFEVDGVRYHHILDTKSGYPSDENLHSVSVIGKNSAICDALSTAFFVMGIDESIPIANQYGVGVMFVTKDSKIYVTDKIWESVEKVNGNYEYIKLGGF